MAGASSDRDDIHLRRNGTSWYSASDVTNNSATATPDVDPDSEDPRASNNSQNAELKDQEIEPDSPISEDEPASVIDGIASMETTNSMRESSMDLDGGDVEQRQTGTDMEELAITLPKVVLRLKVTADQKQRFLDKAKVQTTSDAPKKRVRKPDVRTADTQTENWPVLSVPSRSWADDGDVNDTTSINSDRTEIVDPKAGSFVSDTPPEGSQTFRMPARPDNSYDMEDLRQTPLICDRQTASQHAVSLDTEVLQPSGMTRGSMTGTLLNGQGRDTDAQLLLSGPSWRCDNEQIDVSNHDQFHTVSSHRENAEGRQKMCTDRSTATDPLIQHLAGQSNDPLKRPSDQNSHDDHQDKRARLNPDNDLNNSTGCSPRSSADENEDMTSRDETLTKTTQQDVTNDTSSDSPMTDTTADVRSIRQQSDLTSSASEGSTPIMSASNTDSSSLDAAKIAAFITYAESMKKNLRQDYKNLSLLIGSLTEDQQGRNNNNQPSEGQADQSEMDSEINDKDRCLIM